MFAQLMVFCFVFVTSGAQEHLTCLRTDDLLAPSPPTTNVGTQQGRPGRRGPIGLKGSKGDPGIPDNSLLNSLKENLTSALLRGYMDLAGGWVAPFNGYQYKATPGQQSWNTSRIVCQQWGGDLAQYGVRDVATRLTLYRALSLRGEYWIGLCDSVYEGEWRWLNGNRASTDDGSLWIPRSLRSTHGAIIQDCAKAYFDEDDADDDNAHYGSGNFYSFTNPFEDGGPGLLVGGDFCRSLNLALCEKRVDD